MPPICPIHRQHMRPPERKEAAKDTFYYLCPKWGCTQRWRESTAHCPINGVIVHVGTGRNFTGLATNRELIALLWERWRGGWLLISPQYEAEIRHEHSQGCQHEYKNVDRCGWDQEGLV